MRRIFSSSHRSALRLFPFLGAALFGLTSCVALVPFIESEPAPACATCGVRTEVNYSNTPTRSMTASQRQRGYMRYYMLQLQNPNPAARATAATTLGEYGRVAEPAVPQLLRALHDENKFVRRAAVKALPKIAPESAAVQTGIRAAKQDKDPWVAHSAGKISTGQQVGGTSREVIKAPASK